MLSNCALAAATSTSRLLHARRTFTSLTTQPDNSDQESPVLSVPPAQVLNAPKRNNDKLNHEVLQLRLAGIVKQLREKRLLSAEQKEFLDTLGLVSPSSESHITRELNANRLASLRDFFLSYFKTLETGGEVPELKTSLRKALKEATFRALDISPPSKSVKVKLAKSAKADETPTERRGRIKPTAAPNHIKWDAPDNLTPLANSKLRERSRHDLPSLKSNVLTDIEPVNEMRPIARLAHGLDRALFNPGVNWLQDPRSRVYNYDPWLQKIPSVRDFAFERLPGFVKSSRDEDLWNLCRREGRQFAGSTSSLSGLLCHIYFLLSRDRHVDLSTLSRQMSVFPSTFTPGQRMPAAVILRHRDGVYATDSDSFLPGSAETNVLSWMGTMLEKFLTTDAATFSRYMRESPDPAEPDTDPKREAYRYSMSQKMVMRSQLDAIDPRVPGRGVFDIKTRAAMSVRYDSKNWVENAGYLINKLHGVEESFEREYCDLIRAAFLKYSFQARIGDMDGVMVAYHNTARIFGFQYIPLEEMEARLYGAPERGDRIFNKCVQVLELLLETATGAFPGKSVRILGEKFEADGFLRFWVEPIPDEEADAQITANEQAEQEEAIQLGEGVDPSEIVSRRIQKAKQAADAEEKKRAPIKMFTVQISHILDGNMVPADTAIDSVKKDWDLKVTIERPALEDGELRKMRADARKRQFRANFLPSGVSVNEMAKRWVKEAKINPAHKGPVPAFDRTHWAEADWKTEAVRKLARKGAEETRRLDKLDKEKGHEQLVPEWVQASGVSLPEAKPQVDQEMMFTSPAEEDETDVPTAKVANPLADLQDELLREVEPALLPTPPTLSAEELKPSTTNPPARPRDWTISPRSKNDNGNMSKEAQRVLARTMPKKAMGERNPAPQALTLEEGGGKEEPEKVTERMHEMPHAPEGDPRTHEWDERDNLRRVDTGMDKGIRPSPTYESSVEDWKSDEEKPLPGTKVAAEDEKA